MYTRSCKTKPISYTGISMPAPRIIANPLNSPPLGLRCIYLLTNFLKKRKKKKDLSTKVFSKRGSPWVEKSE